MYIKYLKRDTKIIYTIGTLALKHEANLFILFFDLIGEIDLFSETQSA